MAFGPERISVEAWRVASHFLMQVFTLQAIIGQHFAMVIAIIRPPTVNQVSRRRRSHGRVAFEETRRLPGGFTNGARCPSFRTAAYAIHRILGD